MNNIDPQEIVGVNREGSEVMFEFKINEKDKKQVMHVNLANEMVANFTEILETPNNTLFYMFPYIFDIEYDYGDITFKQLIDEEGRHVENYIKLLCKDIYKTTKRFINKHKMNKMFDKNLKKMIEKNYYQIMNGTVNTHLEFRMFVDMFTSSYINTMTEAKNIGLFDKYDKKINILSKDVNNLTLFLSNIMSYMYEKLIGQQHSFTQFNFIRNTYIFISKFMFYRVFYETFVSRFKNMKDQKFQTLVTDVDLFFKSSLPEIIHSIKEVDKVNQLFAHNETLYRDDIIWIQNIIHAYFVKQSSTHNELISHCEALLGYEKDDSDYEQALNVLRMTFFNMLKNMEETHENIINFSVSDFFRQTVHNDTTDIVQYIMIKPVR